MYGCEFLETSHLPEPLHRPFSSSQRLPWLEIDSGEELQRLLAPFKGNKFAKAAIDTAWWDLAAQLENRPLWEVIRGVSREVAVGADIPVQDSAAALNDRVRAAIDGGFSRTKLKFRPDNGWLRVSVTAWIRGWSNAPRAPHAAG